MLLGQTAHWARVAGRRTIDALLPPRCLKCGGDVERDGALCATCWITVSFIAPPFCRQCGLPFAVDAGPEALCAACLAAPPPWQRARAVFRYDDASRDLVVGFKHADRTYAAPTFGRWLARAAADLRFAAGRPSLLVPVPLHWTRLFLRRYNQAGLLAKAASDNLAIPAVPDLLIRHRRTRSQGQMSRAARIENVSGAFVVRRRHVGRVAGADVLLVDDVLTTGATAAACTRALLRAGAAAVHVLTLARVVRAE